MVWFREHTCHHIICVQYVDIFLQPLDRFTYNTREQPTQQPFYSNVCVFRVCKGCKRMSLQHCRSWCCLVVYSFALTFLNIHFHLWDVVVDVVRCRCAFSIVRTYLSVFSTFGYTSFVKWLYHISHVCVCVYVYENVTVKV